MIPSTESGTLSRLRDNDARNDKATLERRLPSDASIFSFSLGLKWIMLGCSFLSIGFVVFFIVMQLIRPAPYSLLIAIIGVALFGFFATLSLRAFCRLRYRVAVNSDGIWYLPRKGESTFIAWNEVASVKADDVQQQLLLADAGDHRKIRLEYQLNDFERLREFALSHTSASARLLTSGTNIFHRSWINKIVLLSFAGLSLVFAWLSHQPIVGALGVLFLAAVARDPLRVVIAKNALVINYPGWDQTISFNAISGIALKDVYSRGNVWAAVVVERRKGRPIRLFRFREGSVALHDALQSAWRSASGGN